MREVPLHAAPDEKQSNHERGIFAIESISSPTLIGSALTLVTHIISL